MQDTWLGSIRARPVRTWSVAALMVASSAFALTVINRSESSPGSVSASPALAVQPAAMSAIPAATAAPEADYTAALAMWRAPRVKESCASCHGPDFFDLARIGSTDHDIIRRALIDGATSEEADTLLRGVRFLRTRYALAPEDPRSFRPLQPGGALLPGRTTIERDLAFATELETALPTLMSATPIRSRADAERARDELLAVDFERLKIGIPLPLWSADLAQGSGEGTLNDWIADVARVAKPGREAEWLALQDAYLADPSDLNFWKLYFAVDDLTQAFAGITPYDVNDGWKVRRFTVSKYKSALIGQHMLRTRAMGRQDAMRGQVGFAHLASEEPYKSAFRGKAATVAGGEKMPVYLPNPWWDVGDVGRFGFRPTDLSSGRPGNSGGADKMRDTLGLLGYPRFVVDSIDPAATTEAMLDATQLSWFMLGVRLDPGLQRIGQGNSILVGEYLQAQLSKQDYFLHRTFQTALRMVTRTYRPEARGEDPTVYNLHFGYFTGYGRHMPSRWNSPDERTVPADIKAQQIAAYKRFTANVFRMSLYLHEAELDAGRIAPYGTSTRDGDYRGINDFFNYAGLPGRAEDDALVRRVAAKSRTPLTF